MNKMLIAVFDDETAADAGLKALRRLHADGDLTLYATGVLSKDSGGHVSVKHAMDQGPVASGVGLAVGSLIGMLAGPAGLAVGAFTGTAVGALRDFWVAGVGLDFVEQAAQCILPGKAALVAEVEEEWVTPADKALEAAGGMVFRRSRTEVAEAQFDQDVAAFKAELRGLESEASHAGQDARLKLAAKLVTTRAALDGALQRAQRRVDDLQRDADAKIESLEVQLGAAQAGAKARIDDRLRRVRHGYHMRGAKLAQAWGLAKQALAA